MTTWNLTDALELYRDLVQQLHHDGYLLSVYGSILSVKPARDLDLLAIPWRPNPMPPKTTFDWLCTTRHLTPAVGPPYIGLMKSWSHAASDSRGRVIDFQFRYSTVTLEESFAFSMQTEVDHL